MFKFVLILYFSTISHHIFALDDCDTGSPSGAKIIKDMALSEKICSAANNSKTMNKPEILPKVVYGIMSASSKMKQLFQMIEEKISATKQNAVTCPEGCQKKTLPIVEILTKPTTTAFEQQCPKEYSRILMNANEVTEPMTSIVDGKLRKTIRMNKGIKNCQEVASKFSQDTLMGSNDLGKFLEDKKCKSPCSYSSSVQFKVLSSSEDSCSMEVTLDILCGPPKADREWETMATIQVVNQCEAPAWKK